LPTGVEEIRREMMKEIGIDDIDELFKDIPSEVKLKRSLQIPGPYPELEVRRDIAKTLEKNTSSADIPVFLGAGVWPHYVPTVVEEIVRRAEFLTSYTPYQPEASQGMLQALFEYQSMICAVTEMEFANCSLYDWASSLGEAARMVSRVTGRNEVIVPHYLHPERLATLRAYSEPAGIEIIEVQQDAETGQIIIEDLEKKLSSKTAGVYIENPSYLGYVETEVEAIGDAAHRNGSLFIVGVDPISLGIMKPPGEYGADIVIGEGQPLGNRMNFGGSLLGIFTCRGERLLRQMPGRIIGMTTTVDGSQRAYCMVLQTREQHIRREKATSNICSNEALCAVAAAVYLALLGPKGLNVLCKTILTKSQYAMKRISEIKGLRTPVFNAPHFREFTVNFERSGKTVEEIHNRLLRKRIHGGKIVSQEFPELRDTALYCVTEIHSRRDIDILAESLAEILEG
jgi:glycine dehydrogenase subunit 1